MKKILMSAAVMVLAVGALSAQSPWFLGGNLNFDYNKEGDVKTTIFGINPEVGYMFNEKWGMTLDLGFDMWSHDNGDTKPKTNGFGAGLGVIYKMQLTDKFFYAPTARVGYKFEKEDDDIDGTDDLKYNTFGVNINVLRFEFRPNCHWGFNLALGNLGYENSKEKEADDATNRFRANLDRVAVGFTYYF